MKVQASRTFLHAVAVFSVSFAACNRGQDAHSAQEAAPATPQQSQLKTLVPAQMAASKGGPAPVGSVPIPVEPPKTQAVSANVVVADRSETLTVAQRTYRFVEHVQSIPATKEETVEWWELRDAEDHVLHRESYPVTFQNGSFESTSEVSASSFTGKGGGGILIQGMDLPSAPDSGGWIQVFGFRYGREKYGADPTLFGAFGPPIYVEGEFLGVDTDSALATPVAFGAAREMRMSDVLKFRVWTGNFNIVYPVLINYISGRVQPAWRCIETTSKGRVERCSYPITVEARREDQPTFVRLFSEADDGFTPKHVIVQPQSHIEYLEARVPVVWNEDNKAISFSVNGDMWVKIRIDGQEGWIHSEEDFEAAGLPAAG